MTGDVCGRLDKPSRAPAAAIVSSQQEQHDGEKRRIMGRSSAGAARLAGAVVALRCRVPRKRNHSRDGSDGSDAVASSRQSDAMGPLAKLSCLELFSNAWLGSGFQLLQ